VPLHITRAITAATWVSGHVIPEPLVVTIFEHEDCKYKDTMRGRIRIAEATQISCDRTCGAAPHALCLAHGYQQMWHVGVVLSHRRARRMITRSLVERSRRPPRPCRAELLSPFVAPSRRRSAAPLGCASVHPCRVRGIHGSESIDGHRRSVRIRMVLVYTSGERLVHMSVRGATSGIAQRDTTRDDDVSLSW